MLRDVSLDIGKGRIVGIVGESGSGKSTLALSILKLLPANLSRLDGEILFGGENLVALPEARLRRTARQPHLDDLPGSDVARSIRCSRSRRR